MESKKKILYLHNADISSTMANLVQVVSMCSAFAHAGYSTVLVLRSSGLSEEEGKSILTSQFDCHPAVKLRLVRNCMSGKISKHLTHLMMRKLIRDEAPDFCMVRDPRYFSIVISVGVPVVFEFHNIRLHLGSTWLNGYFRKLVLKGAHSIHCVGMVCISKALSDYWHGEGIPAEKLHVLHDGFSGAMFDTLYDKKKAREQLSFPLDRKIVVYSGNLQANRGISFILGMAGAFPDLLFVLVGGTEERKDFYHGEAHEMGLRNIIFIGHKPHKDVPMYLRSADILLAMWSREVPTIMYCSPLKVFEYMASGVPAIMPGYPTIHEVVRDGVEAIIATPDSLESFCQALHRVLGMDNKMLEQMSARARTHAYEFYTWEKRVGSLLGFLPEYLRNP